MWLYKATERVVALSSGDIILETEDLTKEFAGFVAVNGVNLAG